MEIFAPSYKRPDLAKTHKYIKQVTYVISESEAESYRGMHDKFWIVPDWAQGNIARIRNYILDNSRDENVIMVDDDIDFFGRWNGNEHKKLAEIQVYDMINEGTQLATDLGVVYWGINCIGDKGSYREYTPFGMNKFVGGPFQGHRNNPLRFDEKIYLKEDYDMTLQVLNKFRKNLRLNMYHYFCDQATMKGGCATHRNVQREMDMNRMLQKKWGTKIVRLDESNGSKKKKTFDINPIINVPIKGV